MRKCLAEEFSNIYLFHLRGNQRTSGELSRREGGKIFGGGSRAPIAISILVKNPSVTERGRIAFHDIGDYLSREDKLKRISGFGDIAGISKSLGWQAIRPNEQSDWLRQRNVSFGSFTLLGSKSTDLEATLFSSFSNGIVTNRDVWVYNYSLAALKQNCQKMIDFYNREIDRYQSHAAACESELPDVQAFVEKDLTQISWGGGNWQTNFRRFKKEAFETLSLRSGLYRPFCKMQHYGAKGFNHSFYSMLRIFPSAASANIVIMTTGRGANDFSSLISNAIPDLNSMGAGAQCFPLYVYGDEGEEKQSTLFAAPAPEKQKRRDAITDAGLAHFQSAYPGETITKEDLFYYVYGLLHSPDYRERYADNLSKELPRIPRVKSAADFWAFSKAGRDLADLHLNYETVAMHADAKIDSGGKTLTDADYRVEKMKYGKRGKDKDLTTLIYNAKITVTGIPLEAYDYVVNGKPALDWVVERQCVKTDKDSGIVNDANDWAIETMNNPRYPLELFLRVITVSLETMKIVRSLPALDILPN